MNVSNISPFHYPAHYSNKTWTFPRGALATVDRSVLGFVGVSLILAILRKLKVWHLTRTFVNRLTSNMVSRRLTLPTTSRARFLIVRCAFVPPFFFLLKADPPISCAFSDNAWEATEALKVVLGEHYVYSTENVFVSLWKNFRDCQVGPFSPFNSNPHFLTYFCSLVR